MATTSSTGTPTPHARVVAKNSSAQMSQLFMFVKSERAFATGIFNSGTHIGALVAPLTGPWIAATWGWLRSDV